MSTTLTVSAPGTSRRIQVLAAAGGLVAAASIAVAIAVSGGGSDSTSAAPSAAPATAQPNRATLYRNDATAPRPAAIDRRRAALLFHHR